MSESCTSLLASSCSRSWPVSAPKELRAAEGAECEQRLVTLVEAASASSKCIELDFDTNDRSVWTHEWKMKKRKDDENDEEDEDEDDPA